MPIEVNLENVSEIAQALKAEKEPAKSLAEAVCRVMGRVGYVQKDKQMQSGGAYRYVSVEAVIDALRPEMIRQGLVLLPSKVEPIHQGDHGRQLHLRLRYTFRLLHAPSGQVETIEVVGEGMDVGDKSGNKAMTAARKYALIMAFNIETGTDPDDTPSHTQERAAPQPQKAVPVRPANVALRAKYAGRFGACATREDYLAVCKDVGADVKAGVLTEEDRAALHGIAKETSARFPDPAKA